jgi:transcriptional regulator with XRE-family HTH domain
MNMKELRRRSGKRPEDIAVEVGVSVSTVNNWDQGKTSPRMTPMGIARLMRAYGCTFDELMAAESERCKDDEVFNMDVENPTHQ